MAVGERSRLRGTTPAGYRWWRHVLLLVVFQIGGLVLGAAALDQVQPAEWAAVPVFVLLILLGEWASHRYTMHRRVFPRAVHRRHVGEHHAFFTHEQMTIDSIEDLRWVLFPPWALPLLVVSILPWFALLYVLATPNLAWLLLLTVIGYYAVYEVVHAITHLPTRNGRLGRWHAALAHHHRLHHDPALMQRYNFNFAVPLFDRVFGTRASEDGRTKRL